MVGIESIFKEVLLLLLAANDLGAQCFDGGDGLFKRLASSSELVKGAIRVACKVLSAPELDRIAELFGESRGATREIQCLRLVSL